MQCPKCGFENPKGFQFCGKCAHPLEEKAYMAQPFNHLKCPGGGFAPKAG